MLAAASVAFPEVAFPVEAHPAAFLEVAFVACLEGAFPGELGVAFREAGHLVLAGAFP